MQQAINLQTKKWLRTTSEVLNAQPEGLQKLLLQISMKDPDVSFYASDLAKLRMSGMEMENTLTRIWNADSSSTVDQIIIHQYETKHPCIGVLTFFADLVKNNLDIITSTTH